MKEYKYIIFIIVGILLFLLLNTSNTFSIGNQYMLDYLDTSVVGNTRIYSNDVLLRMFIAIVNGSNICMENDFEQCYITMLQGGGSCQINTLIGLFQTALGIPFSPDDHDYIDSQGLRLKGNVLKTIDYLTNRDSMRLLLSYNHIDPNTPLTKSSDSFKMGRLYPLYIGILPLITPQFFRDDGNEYAFGHNILMYKTNLSGLASFIESIPATNRQNDEFTQLSEEKTRLDGLNYNDMNINRDNFNASCIVYIMIDLCNSFFYAITEASSPSTLSYFANPAEYQLEAYNYLWRLKVITQFARRVSPYEIIRFTPNGQSEQITVNMSDLEQSHLDISPMQGKINLLIQVTRVYTYMYTIDPSINIGTMTLKNPESFKGYLNTLCQANEVCRTQADGSNILYCDAGSQYNVCKVMVLDDMLKIETFTIYDSNPNTIFSKMLYVYNPDGEENMNKDLSQLRENIIYLGYFEKLRRGRGSTIRDTWEARHFFLKWDEHGLNIIYVVVTHRHAPQQGWEHSSNPDPVASGEGVTRLDGDTNPVITIKNTLPISTYVYREGGRPPAMYGTPDDPDNTVTILQYGSDLILRYNGYTPIDQLKKILQYVKLKWQPSLCSPQIIRV